MSLASAATSVLDILRKHFVNEPNVELIGLVSACFFQRRLLLLSGATSAILTCIFLVICCITGSSLLLVSSFCFGCVTSALRRVINSSYSLSPTFERLISKSLNDLAVSIRFKTALPDFGLCVGLLDHVSGDEYALNRWFFIFGHSLLKQPLDVYFSRDAFKRGRPSYPPVQQCRQRLGARMNRNLFSPIR